MPEITKRKIVAQSRIFTIEQLDLRFSNGVQVQYERLCPRGQGAVLIVPLLDDDTVLLIREYAAGVERYELALPKGKIDANETVEEAANRELAEEVGYAAHSLQRLKSLSASPGYLANNTHVVLATQLYEKRLPGDEPEPIEVVPWKLSELEQLLRHPECTEARTIAALFMVKYHQPA
ncbi:MAG: ADP compounds hydrolase NudE [Gammaproteobacteria bacterium]|nr:ADP compounds hydrolase NudE [Gammaproteobacteria bacterium]MDH5799671.1 ADP compounds hydrolase NudE [Gammaproteobacteria bacterium]